MWPPSDRPLPPIQPLASAPFPKGGEHFGSYVRRLASANGHASIGTLATHLGLLTMSPRSSEKVWGRLAEATGLEPNRLDVLRMGYEGSRKVPRALVDGFEIQSNFLDSVHLRSCPLCLAEDGFLGTRLALRHVTACIRHDVQLTDECRCGAPRRSFDRHALWNCSSCGLAYSNMPSEPADHRELLVSRMLSSPSALRPSDQMPAPLLSEPLTGRIAVIERLGRLLLLEKDDAPSASHHNVTNKLPDGADKRRRIQHDRGIAIAAADLLTGWPQAYHALLERLMDRYPDPGVGNVRLRRFASQAGHLAMRRFVDHDRRVIPFADEAREAFLKVRVGHSHGAVLRRSGHFGAMPCAPSQEVNGPRSEIAFVTAFEFGTRLHVGDRFRIEAWFEAGLIGTVRHVDGSVLVRRADFDALMARVRDLPRAEGDDGEFEDYAILNNRRGAFYRQRFLIEDVLAGRIGSRPTDDGSEGLRSLRLRRRDFERRRMLCKTAIQIIRDDFVGVPDFIPALWQSPTPTKAEIDSMCASGAVRCVPGRPRDRLAVRDLVAAAQQKSGRTLFLTTTAALADRSEADWLAIVVKNNFSARDPA